MFSAKTGEKILKTKTRIDQWTNSGFIIKYSESLTNKKYLLLSLVRYG